MGEKASFLYPIGQIWLNLLFVLLVPLLFFSISSSIANISDTKSVGKLLGFTLVIFVVTAAIAGSFMFVVLGIFGVDTSVQLALVMLLHRQLLPVSVTRSLILLQLVTSRMSFPEDISWH